MQLNKLDPVSTMNELGKGVVAAVEEYFPIEGKNRRLEVSNVRLGGDGRDTDRMIDDIRAQRNARMTGRTWALPVKGDFRVVDKQTGNVVGERKGMRILSLPHITRRYSYIIDGTEYAPDNQLRLKSGVYHHVRGNGQLSAQWNLAKGRGFSIEFEPDRARFMLRYGTSNISAVPVLRALGVSDDQMRTAWGAEAFDRIAAHKQKGTLKRLAKEVSRNVPDGLSDADYTQIIRDAFQETELRTDTTSVTLGAPAERVTGDALLRSTTKLLKINRGDAEPDERDSMRFAALLDISDHIPERIRNSRVRTVRKIKSGIDRKTDPRQIVPIDVFGLPVKSFFTSTSLAQQPDQTNPVLMLGGALRTTIMGQGGIGSDHAVNLDAKVIDGSQLGVIDPVYTPEGARTGITNHLALGVAKDGQDAKVKVFDARTGAPALLTPAEMHHKTIAFPDEYTVSRKDGARSYTPKGDKVIALPAGGGDPREVAASSVDYVLRSPHAMLSVATALVPFAPSDQANRLGMADRHLEQAVSLVNREEPLIQSASSAVDTRPDLSSWEKIFGGMAAHKSPVDGVVSRIDDDAIFVKDAAGKEHEVQLYNNFPLNEKKGVMHSTPLVSVGDKVSKREVVADTNYTRGGVLSQGVNIRAAYLPFKGLTFEDGVVVSEEGARKLTSLHMHKLRAQVSADTTTDPGKYRAQYPGKLTSENAEKLEDGVVKVGQRVRPGDVLATIMRKRDPSEEQILLRGIHRSLDRQWQDASITWEKPYEGIVTDVVRIGGEIKVHVRTEEPAQVGDKVSGRHGNKGVITAVLPDDQMPKDKDGNPVHIIMNPSGVPGRINLGQVLETSLAKVAEANGENIEVSSFASEDGARFARMPRTTKKVEVAGHWRTVKTGDGSKRVWIEPYSYERDYGYQAMVQKVLDEAGISETEELFDPETGRSLGQVLVGPQYILKHTHQVEKKLSARAHGAGYGYDINGIPRSSFGKDDGAQRFGELGLYSMLAHGAVHNIRDALTYKSDQAQAEVWTAIQTGQPLPAPQVPFAYEKFVGYLNALGMDVQREGSKLHFLPLTDKQVEEMSNGELTDGGRVVRGKDLGTEKGGLFDEEITGGLDGDKWSHIRLPGRYPNPVFEKAIRSLLGLKQSEYDAVVAGTAGIAPDGSVVDDGGDRGPEAIARALDRVDHARGKKEAQEQLRTASGADLNRANRKVRYYQALEKAGMGAGEAYTLSSVPVVPPRYRPLTVMESGDLNIDGLNLLYREVALLKDKLAQAEGVLPDEDLRPLRSELYGAVSALMGTAAAGDLGMTSDGTARPPGILALLSGPSTPKSSFFHKKLMDRKQDLSARSIIVPDMDLHLDELGVPVKAAQRIFRPFVVRRLHQMGITPLKAQEMIDKRDPLAMKALQVEMSERPVLFKRDPVLHKFGIMAFKPVLVEGKSIHIHPLTVGGFNADFDGDAMSMFVPVSPEAVEEAKGMMPSKNIFNPATGVVMYQPTMEGQLGLYLLSQFGQDTGQSFSSLDAARAAHQDGKIKATQVISINGRKTTPGRVAIAAAFPKSMPVDDILFDKGLVLGADDLQKMMRRVAENHPLEFAATMDRLKSLGYSYASDIGFSFSLSDFKVLDKVRDKHLSAAKKQVDALPASLSTAERNEAIIQIYNAASSAIDKEAKPVLKEAGNKLYAMSEAGVKPKWAQLKQMLIAPLLVENSKGEVIPAPVTRSYAEGLTSSGFWTAAYGARKGLIEKVQSVSEPGALSKQIVNTSLPLSVTVDDCGTTQGIRLPLSDRADIDGRYLAEDVRLKGGRVFKAGASLTPNVVNSMRTAGVTQVVVRSAHKCSAAKGICGKCYGDMDTGAPPEPGTNIGLIAGQAIGERGTQLSMKAFHMGGVAGAGSGVTAGLPRIIQLLKMPKVLPGKASLAQSKGTVTEVRASPLGGYDVKIGETPHYIPGGRKLTVAAGDEVRKGDAISTGPVDPRELLDLTNIGRVQAYLTDEIGKVYSGEGIKRRNMEVLVRALTNLGRVEDPGPIGEEAGMLRGDHVSLSAVAALNKEHKGTPIKVKPVLRGVETLPLDQMEGDLVSRLQYRRLKETYQRGFAEGWTGDIHGIHPAAALLYSKEFGKKTDKSTGPY